MSDCKRCKERGKTWNGNDPRCGFSSGVFSSNWNCATLNELRDIENLPDAVQVYSEDHNAALIPFGAEFVCLVWYKRRGECDQAWVINSSGSFPLSLKYAEAVLDKLDPYEFKP